jgi:membrane protein CcdC involved in cytochrome C biogenesis
MKEDFFAQGCVQYFTVSHFDSATILKIVFVIRASFLLQISCSLSVTSLCHLFYILWASHIVPLYPLSLYKV